MIETRAALCSSKIFTFKFLNPFPGLNCKLSEFCFTDENIVKF